MRACAAPRDLTDLTKAKDQATGDAKLKKREHMHRMIIAILHRSRAVESGMNDVPTPVLSIF